MDVWLRCAVCGMGSENCMLLFFFSSRRRHTRCALVTGVQTGALPIYLFTGESSAESDGARPLGGTLYYNRLAQRLSAALSVPTAQGALYEVDTRLRPQGARKSVV